MIVWVVEERAYREDNFGIERLDYTDPVYLASTKEKAIEFVYEHRTDTENVFASLDIEVAIYPMSVDILDGTFGPDSDSTRVRFYDCRTIEEWCKEYASLV